MLLENGLSMLKSTSLHCLHLLVAIMAVSDVVIVSPLQHFERNYAIMSGKFMLSADQLVENKCYPSVYMAQLC